MNAIDLTRRPACWGPQGWLGLLLVAVCWPLNWTLPGNRTAYLFFPLWLGYILVVDCPGSAPDRHLALATLTEGLRAALRNLGAGLVDLRSHQPADS